MGENRATDGYGSEISGGEGDKRVRASKSARSEQPREASKSERSEHPRPDCTECMI